MLNEIYENLCRQNAKKKSALYDKARKFKMFRYHAFHGLNP
jgi:hypothetical protein